MRSKRISAQTILYVISYYRVRSGEQDEERFFEKLDRRDECTCDIALDPEFRARANTRVANLAVNTVIYKPTRRMRILPGIRASL